MATRPDGSDADVGVRERLGEHPEVVTERAPYLGRTLAGRYEVLRKLNQGGVGAIYLSIQHPLERPVALRVLLRALAGDPTATKRFGKEALSIARLSHAHIVTVHDFGTTDDGDPLLAMEILRGQSLRDLLDCSPGGQHLSLVKQLVWNDSSSRRPIEAGLAPSGATTPTSRNAERSSVTPRIPCPPASRKNGFQPSGHARVQTTRPIVSERHTDVPEAAVSPKRTPATTPPVKTGRGRWAPEPISPVCNHHASRRAANIPA